MACMIHYPWLHPKLVRLEGLTTVKLLDPGVDMHTETERWQPANLPFSNIEVRRLLREYLQFGEQFAKPADMEFFQIKGLDNFYTDTGMELRSQLLNNEPGEPAEDPLRRQKQAQLVLALALFREEQYVALREQESQFEGARDKFAQSLGLDDDEVFAEIGLPGDDAIFPRASVDLPWRDLMESFLCYLPENWDLFISDPDVLAEMLASGLQFHPCTIDGAAYVCCDLDDNSMMLLSGKQLAVTSALRLVARPLNP